MRSILKFAIIAIIGLVSYNYFYGNEVEKARSKKVVEGVKDVFVSVKDLVKSEKEKFDEGKYDSALDKVGGLFKDLKEQTDDISDDLKDRLANLEEEKELLQERAYYLGQLESVPSFLKDEVNVIKLNIDKVEKRIAQNQTGVLLSDSRSTWKELTESLIKNAGFSTLFNKLPAGIRIKNNDLYAKTLLLDQFARRIPRERSLENLGLINIVYPALDNLVEPEIAIKLGITKEEWHSLLKISIDYIIRYNFHFFFNRDYYNFTSRLYRSKSIYPSNTQVVDAVKWRLYNPKAVSQSKLVLLICAGLGWHDKGDITKIREDQLNELLENIWKTLRNKVLSDDGGGFKLDFEKITLLLS